MEYAKAPLVNRWKDIMINHTMSTGCALIVWQLQTRLIYCETNEIHQTNVMSVFIDTQKIILNRCLLWHQYWLYSSLNESIVESYFTLFHCGMLITQWPKVWVHRNLLRSVCRSSEDFELFLLWCWISLVFHRFIDVILHFCITILLHFSLMFLFCCSASLLFLYSFFFFFSFSISLSLSLPSPLSIAFVLSQSFSLSLLCWPFSIFSRNYFVESIYYRISLANIRIFTQNNTLSDTFYLRC